jgi:signal transduction histidine kinase
MNGHEKVNILLVDDQPAKLMSYELILHELDETLIKAGSATEALTYLLRNEIAVILIDVCMPELNGFDLAAMIREHPRFEKTAIIFVSAIQVDEGDLLRGYQCGAVDYVPVPVVPELLRAKVRVFADLYRKGRQLEQLNAELEQRVAERTDELARANTELEIRVEQRTQERERALAQVHQMQKLESLGQLTGGIAHDFNNLLMAVLGNLELLKKRLPEDPKIVRLLDGAFQGAQRGAQLTRRMLAFARRQDLKPESVHVPALVHSMTDILERSVGPEISIETHFETDLPPCRIDPNQLELALLNLSLNARDAMPNGGILTISARRESLGEDISPSAPQGEYLRLTVRDSGSGMDEATLKRATEPFFTTKEVGKGTGLGLSTVEGLAAQSGGAMRITSAPGAGTAIDLWLPLSVAIETDATEDGDNRTANEKRYRILVVDDDPIVADGTVALLQDLGHAVVGVRSGVSALAELKAGQTFDLLITDHAMPGMNGAHLAEQVREAWPSLPIILVSGCVELPSGIDPTLPRLAKPYRQADLENMIATCLANHRVTPGEGPRRGKLRLVS